MPAKKKDLQPEDAAPAPRAYEAGAVKQDPETLDVAVKVNDNMPGEWMITRLNKGGRYADFQEISHWPDLNSL